MNNDKPRLLIFHPALAPYRLDFFNALADRFTCHVVLLQRENPALFIKQDQLLAEARFTYAYLDRHFTLAGRDINLGYASAIRHFRHRLVFGVQPLRPLRRPLSLAPSPPLPTLHDVRR